MNVGFGAFDVSSDMACDVREYIKSHITETQNVELSERVEADFAKDNVVPSQTELLAMFVALYVAKTYGSAAELLIRGRSQKRKLRSAKAYRNQFAAKKDFYFPKL